MDRYTGPFPEKEKEKKERAPAFNVLITDLGRVIVDFPHFYESEIILSKCRAGREECRKFLGGREIGAYEKNEISTRDFFAAVRQKLGYCGDYDSFYKDFGDIFSLKRDVFELLFWRVKPMNDIQIFLLSNLGEFHYEWINCRWPGIFSNCRRNFLSFEMGMRKPEPEIYKVVLEKSGAYAPTCLFVDDLEANCIAARECGMGAVRFEGAEKLKKTLESYGIKT